MTGLVWGLVLVGATGCGQTGTQEPAIGLEWSLSPDPRVVGPATLAVSLTDTAGAPLTGAEIGLEANMSHAGMKPVFAASTERDSGRYLLPFEFTMAGDWYARLEIRRPDGSTTTRLLELPGVRPE